jgi:hypothetical protein
MISHVFHRIKTNVPPHLKDLQPEYAHKELQIQFLSKQHTEMLMNLLTHATTKKPNKQMTVANRNSGSSYFVFRFLFFLLCKNEKKFSLMRKKGTAM